MKKFLVFLMLLFSLTSVFANDAEPEIEVKNPVIVIPGKADAIKKFAAEELKKHLELISGKKIEITEKTSGGEFPFYVGIPFPDDKTPLKNEEARYRITPSGIYLYGEDAPLADIFNLRVTRTGTMFAVYFFLENELGVRWTEPGDDGIVYKPQPELSFAVKDFSWVPQLKQRNIRLWFSTLPSSVWNLLPKKMAYSKDSINRIIRDHNIWFRRMRQGASEPYNYGHAFTKWWAEYSKIHPEYFALTLETGKRDHLHRGKADRPDLVKLCVSNRNVHKQVVENWLEEKQKHPDRIYNINVCENDGWGFCTCPACIKLDVRKEEEPLVTYLKNGKPLYANMTDRYIWFSNEILKLAREKYPDTKAIMYGYGTYVNPPRREKLSDGIIIGLVPSMLQGTKAIEQTYKGWKNMGAEEFLLRPNDMHMASGLPMGYEKQLFDAFKVGLNNGIIGMDFDSLTGAWESDGLADYVIARGSTYPDKSFDYWVDEYCSSFGPAKDDMKEYYKYWRANWNKRIWNENVPDREKTLQDAVDGYRVVLRKMLDYFTPADFDATDAILEKASAKMLSSDERKRIEKMKLFNKHSRLSIELLAVFSDKNSSLSQRVAKAQEVLKFRTENRDKIKMNWPSFFEYEGMFGDDEAHKWNGPLHGAMGMAEALSSIEPISQNSLDWKFKIDNEDVGMKENWKDAKWDDLCKKWLPINTTCSWNKAESGLPEELRTKLTDYNGKAWYAAEIQKNEKMKDRKVYLLFEAVDDSCIVFVNGQKTGEHIYKKSNDWCTPFSIRIDQCFNNEETQQIRVMVSNKVADGGIWKPVWIAVGK